MLNALRLATTCMPWQPRGHQSTSDEAVTRAPQTTHPTRQRTSTAMQTAQHAPRPRKSQGPAEGSVTAYVGA